jgi:hypothetical protein
MFIIPRTTLGFGNIHTVGTILNFISLLRAMLTSPIKSFCTQFVAKGRPAEKSPWSANKGPNLSNRGCSKMGSEPATWHVNHALSTRAVGNALPILGGCLCTTREMPPIPPAAVISRNSRGIWTFANSVSPLKTTWAALIKPFFRSGFIYRWSCMRGRGSCCLLIKERVPFRAPPSWPFIGSR